MGLRSSLMRVFDRAPSSGSDSRSNTVLSSPVAEIAPPFESDSTSENARSDHGTEITTEVNQVRSLEDLCVEIARPFDVFPGIHPNDHLYGFLRKILPSEAEAVSAYFTDGSKSAAMFADLISEYPGTSRALEFASGYGRVTRHMKHAAPSIDLTACDIHPEANRFVSEDVGVKTIGSSLVPEEFAPTEQYDMAFALSLFSHLPASSWTRWLGALLQAVRPGGIVAFTTHGRITARNESFEIPRDSLLFKEISEQDDLEASTYGTAYVTAKYAFEQINSLGNARIVDFSEGYWWGHQDLYVIQRTH